MSRTKLVTLSDGQDNEHEIVFFNGLAIEIICSKLGKCLHNRLTFSVLMEQ
ncbi:MAG: hypothetical protein ACYTXI_41200 [Nostoc sp.]